MPSPDQMQQQTTRMQRDVIGALARGGNPPDLADEVRALRLEIEALRDMLAPTVSSLIVTGREVAEEMRRLRVAQRESV